MITGVHTMFYSSDADGLRAFLRDRLGFPATDVGGGWLILDLPAAEMGCHPADDTDGKRNGTHDISFMCDDIHATVKELRGRGVEFTREVRDDGFGWTTEFVAPGALRLMLYQPKYRTGGR